MSSFERVGLHKSRCVSNGSLIVTKHPIATEVGRDMLASGGNAIDAAIACSFTLGVVEPYMSGLGGVGLALVYANHGLSVLDAGPVAPRNLDVDRYRLAGDDPDTDLFGWPRVVDDANLLGATSVCVPTTVALMEALYTQGASLPWRRLVEPAISLARRGYAPDWLLTLSIAQDQRSLGRMDATRRIFLPEDHIPAYDMDGVGHPVFRQEDLADTLEAIATGGAGAFYRGEIADTLAHTIRHHGGDLDSADLAEYSVRISSPIRVPIAGADVWLTDGLNGGPTVAELLRLYDLLVSARTSRESPAQLATWIRAARLALEDRFTVMGHQGQGADIGTLAHARRRTAGAPTPHVAPPAADSTTYLAVVDREGNGVSLNLTLLSRWGSKFIAPGLGVLLNNGMMWFDPMPERPNSIAPGARPLANMAPAAVTRGDTLMMLLGASGGRRIISAVPQILHNVLTFDMDIQDAIEAPRLEFTTDPMLADQRFTERTVVEVARSEGVAIGRYLPRLASGGFSSPLGAHRTRDGRWAAGMDPTGLGTPACTP